VPDRRDLLRGAVWTVLAVVPTLLGFNFDDHGDLPVQAHVAAALPGLATIWWLRSPRAAWIIGTVGLLAGGPFGLPLIPFCLALALVLNAARRDTVAGGVAAMLIQAAAGIVGSAIQGDSVAIFTFMPETAWATGWVLRDRDHVTARLIERARELEEEREAYAQLSVRYERARIASELHDIVAHAISVMVVQAGAGQRLARVDPELSAEAFAAIAEAARRAEQDMGRLVALLGDEDAIGDAPDLRLIEELVAHAAGSGLDVTLRLEGQREGLPAQAVETAYRVVQESLTNALRYAAGAHVRVLVRGGADELAVEVVNGPAAAHRALRDTGTGNGLRGLHERTGACGGRLDAGPTDEGGWRVSATLPRRALVVA
jgi:signal transduction histidine kinase